MTRPPRMRICLPAVATAIAAALLAPAAASAAPVVPGQVIVRYEAASSGAQRADARDETGTRAIEGLGMARTQLLTVTDGDSVAATVRQLEAQPGVAYAEPNGFMEPASVPNDPLFSQQWGLRNDGQTVGGVAGTIGADIDAPPAWNLQTGIAPGLTGSPIVAVMDTGADLTHPDLQNELWTNTSDGSHGYDWIPPAGDTDPTDLSGHGTHVSGIIAAEGDNTTDTTGVAQHASLMELRVCGAYTSGCPVSDEIAAINYAGAHGAQVLNGSLVGGTYYQALQDALKNNPDVLYVFAAGNNGANDDSSPVYPCALDQVGGYPYDNVICVAASDQNDHLASFSNYGQSTVDLAAPGVNVLSTSSRTAIPIDDFESGFGNWTNSPSNTPPGADWSLSSEAPLTSAGLTDSAGGFDYLASTDSTVTSNWQTLPAGYSTCEIDYDRAIDLGPGDDVLLSVQADVNHDGNFNSIQDDSSDRDFTASDNTSTMLSRSLSLSPAFQPGVPARVQLTLHSNASGEADGAHFDNFRFVCHGSPSDGGVEYLSGTSMATPMVSGAAALLFAQAPLSTPSQVKTALLGTVDRLTALSGVTVTGGRLNAFRALSGDFNPAAGGGGGGGVTSGGGGSGGSTTSRRPNTFFNRKPGRVVRTARTSATVVFRFGSDQAGVSFVCALDRSSFVPCGKRYAPRLLPGSHVLKVKAVNRDGAVDATPAVARFRLARVG
jgi:thermitase